MTSRTEIAAKMLASLVIVGGGIPSENQIKKMVKVSFQLADALLAKAEEQLH